ncbi:hypothetical protein ACET3Z_007084 [Daucus carota]
MTKPVDCKYPEKGLLKNLFIYSMEAIRIKQTVPRARSFREEGYTNRRIFLRSYPLHWGGDDRSKELEKTAPEGANEAKKHLKKIIISIFNWGEERVIIFRSSSFPIHSAARSSSPLLSRCCSLRPSFRLRRTARWQVI